MDEKLWFLKNCDLFERLDPERIGALESRSKARSFERGGLIFLPTDQSDAVLLLVSGRVRIYHITPDGKQAVLAIVDPGELFGELAIFDSGPREEFAEAMERTHVVLIPGAEVRRLMEEQPLVSLRVTQLMGLRRRRTDRRLKSLLFRSNRDRLVHLLLELAERYGRRTSDGVVLNMRLSHQDLAGMIGSTRETVTVQLGELQNEGQVTIRRRQITLRRIEQLASSIDAVPPPIGRAHRPQPEADYRGIPEPQGRG